MYNAYKRCRPKYILTEIQKYVLTVGKLTTVVPLFLDHLWELEMSSYLAELVLKSRFSITQSLYFKIKLSGLIVDSNKLKVVLK